MSDFQLVDLVSQREAVRDRFKGKPKEEILQWLAARGQLVQQDDRLLLRPQLVSDTLSTLPMGFKCSECGGVHEELPRYFMRRLPEAADGSTIRAEEERKSMCRTADQTFVRCEVEVPIAGSDQGPLGFILWVEVDAKDYERILSFREDEETKPIPKSLIKGTLANPVSGVPGSFGTPVKLEICKGDPTPYIKWVAPRSSLAALLETGASVKFWHELAAGKV